jgi:NAD+ synthase (glutamine-hydrolysing)
VSSRLRVALAQLDLFVGAIEANAGKIIATVKRARDELGCDLVVFPELALSGYPPEDLLLHTGMRVRISASLERVRAAAQGIAVLVGYPEYVGEAIHNAATLYRDGAILGHYRKQLLPNYAVFDEMRYFEPGEEPCVAGLGDAALGLTVCEDIWEPEPCAHAAGAGAGILVTINGSPYSVDSQAKREAVARSRARENALPMIYVNMVGGQDELVFDGGSMVLDGNGEIVFRAPAFEEGVHVVELERGDGRWTPVPGHVEAPLEFEASVYGALVTGTRDYVGKHGFPGVVIGLSGGIDSALTLAVAVDAIGAERVQTLMMPFRYTAGISVEDAARMADGLGVRHDVLPIEGMYEATLATLEPLFSGLPEDTAEENIQSRCRGMLLMALSNKTGRMVLTTGNKSEMAVGYATLYGDMAGGFAPIKDCSKTLVYRLARYRNGVSPVIPERIITRPPSAELRPDQKDTDSLPPYEVLDPILEAFIEEDLSVDEIAARGYDREVVGRVLTMVRRNEYKRRQAPPGVRISRRAFGKDWRYPITSGY